MKEDTSTKIGAREGKLRYPVGPEAIFAYMQLMASVAVSKKAVRAVGEMSPFMTDSEIRRRDGFKAKGRERTEAIGQMSPIFSGLG